MGVPTPHFVDPNINADGGAGTLIDPWTRLGGIDVVENGIFQIGGRDAVNGDQINVRTGADDLPTAVIDTAALVALGYGAPTDNAPLIVRGYDFAAFDGGRGGMDGGAGGFSIFDGNAGAGADFVHFIDMHLHNTAAATALWLGDYSSAIGCQIDTAAGNGLRGNNYCRFENNYVHDVGLRALLGGESCDFTGNYVESMAAGSCIFVNGRFGTVQRNICVATVVGVDGIRLSASRAVVDGNSIFSSAAGTGAGILLDANNHDSIVIRSNLIEGFSGVGGSGIDFANLIRHVNLYANNSFFDNGPLGADDEINRGDFNFEEDNDLAMASSPFAKRGALTFANRFTYFAPRNVGSVRRGAYPNGCRSDRGAVQHSDSILGDGTFSGGFA